MKLGLFGMPIHPAALSPSETYDLDAERIILADELGFDEAFIGEHMSTTTEPIISSLTFLASLIHRTKNIKLGSGVISLPNHHPATIAGHVAQFDHMAKGRFIFGIGPGGLASDMELFGVLDGQVRAEKFREAIDIILEIWSTDGPYRFDTKHYSFGTEVTSNVELNVGEIIRPYQLPHPPIALSTMSPSSSSVTTAVKRGWMPMTANNCAPSVVKSHWPKYVEGCEAIGKEPTGDDWRVARNIVIADTDAEAYDRAHDPNGPNHFYFDYLWRVLVSVGYESVMNGDPNRPHDQVTVENLIDETVIYGSPETVTAKIAALREDAPFGSLMMTMLDGSNGFEAYERETMRRLATEVAPRLSTSASAREAVSA